MKHSNIWFYITTITSVLLIILGFIVPPTGVIDGSVLTAVGELFAFAALAQIPTLIKRGADVTLQHGETSLTLNNPDKPKTTENED